MGQGILSLQNNPITSENLLPKFCTFNDTSFTWNTVSGGGAALAENSPDKKLYGKGAIRVTFLTTGTYVFNCGGSQMDFTAPQDGDYIPSWWFYKNDVSADMTVVITIFINGSAFANTTYTQNLYNDSGFVDDNWNCYFADEMLHLLENDVVTWQFQVHSDTAGSGIKLYIDGLKLELNDVNLNSVPSFYTEPLPILIEGTETIDIPSIPSNSSYTVVAPLIGAIVGDFVQMTYPVELVTEELAVAVPMISDADEVSFVVHNHTGGAVNVGSGDYKFKIIR